MLNGPLNLPNNSDDFETLCCLIAHEKFQDNNAQKYGRSGFKQWGVDIKATDRNTSVHVKVVIQCKFKGINNRQSLTSIKDELKSELDQALSKHQFEQFIYATTISNDPNLIDYAQTLESETGKAVAIWFIDDIENAIAMYPRLTRLYTTGDAKHGVTIINQDFIDQLTRDKTTNTNNLANHNSASPNLVNDSSTDTDSDVFRFYSGYSGQNLQWQGIIDNLDAPRHQTKAIQNQIAELQAKTRLESKVAAVVYGTGGSGKSTLLRRLAIDYVKHQANHLNWWVEDIDVFLNFDANCISQWQQHQHLIFIEDWYRNVQSSQIQPFFKWLNQQNNVIVVIGDRNNKGKYNQYLYDNYSQLLTPEDNHNILQHIFSVQILGNTASLKPIIAQIKAQPELINNTSISMVLFVIAWLYNNQQNNDAFDIKDGFENNFKAIITSLLKSIESDKRYQGLGKALYVAAKYYAHPKTNFLLFQQKDICLMADILGPNDNLQERIEYEGQYPYQVAYLVHNTHILTKNGLKFIKVAFNHDVIAEKGIAAINDRQMTLDNYQLEQLLKALISNKNINGSLHLWLFLIAENNGQVTDSAFMQLKQITNIADAFEVSGPWVAAIKALSHPSQKQQICKRILVVNEFYKKVDFGIVSTALNLLKTDPEGIKAAKTILSVELFYEVLPFEIISNALNLLKTKPEGIEAAKTILSVEIFYKVLPFEIISNSLNLLSSEPEGINAAKTIVAVDEFYKLAHQIISTALNLLKSQPVGIEAAKTILAVEEFYRILPKEITCKAISLVADQTEGFKAGRTIYQLSKSSGISPELLFTALRTLCFSDDKTDINMTHDIYQTFANGAKNKSPSLSYQYHQTFLLPLMHIKAHKNRIYGLLKHHKTTNSPLQKFDMFKVLKCYTIDYPDKNQLLKLINQTQNNILLCSTDDLKHQLDEKLDRLQIGHINLSFQNTPDSPIKTQKAREIFVLADEHPQIKQTHLYQIVQDVLTVASV